MLLTCHSYFCFSVYLLVQSIFYLFKYFLYRKSSYHCIALLKFWIKDKCVGDQVFNSLIIDITNIDMFGFIYIFRIKLIGSGEVFNEDLFQMIYVNDIVAQQYRLKLYLLCVLAKSYTCTTSLITTDSVWLV